MWDKVERVTQMAPSEAAARTARRPLPAPCAPSRPRLACPKGRSAPCRPRRPDPGLKHRGTTAALRLACRDGMESASKAKHYLPQGSLGAFPDETSSKRARAARSLSPRDLARNPQGLLGAFLTETPGNLVSSVGATDARLLAGRDAANLGSLPLAGVQLPDWGVATAARSLRSPTGRDFDKQHKGCSEPLPPRHEGLRRKAVASACHKGCSAPSQPRRRAGPFWTQLPRAGVQLRYSGVARAARSLSCRDRSL